MTPTWVLATVGPTRSPRSLRTRREARLSLAAPLPHLLSEKVNELIIRKALIASCAIVLALGLASCSNDSDSSASATTTDSVTATSASTATSSAAATTSEVKTPELSADDMKAMLDLIGDPTVPAQEKVDVISLDGALDWIERLEEMNAGLAARTPVTFEITDNSSSVYAGGAEALARFAGSRTGFRVDWVIEDGVWKLDHDAVRYFMSFVNPEVRTPVRPR